MVTFLAGKADEMPMNRVPHGLAQCDDTEQTHWHVCSVKGETSCCPDSKKKKKVQLDPQIESINN